MANDERDAAYDLIIVGNPFLCPLRRAMANDSKTDTGATAWLLAFLCPLRRAMANDRNSGSFPTALEVLVSMPSTSGYG